MEKDIKKIMEKTVTRFRSPDLLDSVKEDSYRVITTYEPVCFDEYPFYDVEKDKFNYQVLNNFLRDSGFIRGKGGDSKNVPLYRFDLDTGFYESVDYAYLLTYISRTLVNNGICPVVTSSFDRSLTNLLFALPATDEVCGCKEYFDLQKYYEDESTIAFKNGFYNIRYNKFLPLTSCIFRAYHVDVEFNPLALDNDIGQRYREMMTSDEEFELLMELCGNAIYDFDEPLIPTYVLFYGQGSNGKSVVIEALQRIIGINQCSSVNLEYMTDPFMLAMCKGKRANVVPDASKGFVDFSNKFANTVSSFIKDTTDGTGWAFNEKHKQGRGIKEPACTKFIFGSNHYLNMNDTTNGAKRRFHAIPFTKTFENDRALSKRFKGKEETEWFAMRAFVAFINTIDLAMGGRQYLDGENYSAEYIKCEDSQQLKSQNFADGNCLTYYLKYCTDVDLSDNEEVVAYLLNPDNFSEDLYHDMRTYFSDSQDFSKFSCKILNSKLLEYGLICSSRPEREGDRVVRHHHVYTLEEYNKKAKRKS